MTEIIYEEKEAFCKRMNALLDGMYSGNNFEDINELELELEEKQSHGVRLHKLKSALVGFVRNIASQFSKDIKNKHIVIPFNDICQVCFLFYWGLYPSLYLLNGSGEDGDEYHCNGILVINVTDGRLNYLNIYNANNPQLIITMNEDWDKSHCATCVIESVHLPKMLLKQVNDNKQQLFKSNIRYNCIFRCGGTSVDTLCASIECSVIIYKNDSKLLTKIDDRIIKKVQQVSTYTDNIIDSLNAYQVRLPDVINCDDSVLVSDAHSVNFPTECSCAWSDKHGLIVIFRNSNCIYCFQWYDSFQWKKMCAEPMKSICVYKPSICRIVHNNEECLFVTGDDSNNDVQGTNTGLYSFKNKKWIALEDRVKGRAHMKTNLCFDGHRNNVYVATDKLLLCYDIKSDKWRNDFFPSYPKDEDVEEGFVQLVAIFVDTLSGNRLFLNTGWVYSIDLDNPYKWERCQYMQFADKLVDSPLHSNDTYERLFSSQ